MKTNPSPQISLRARPACYYKMTKSPVGELKLIATDKGLAAILWEDDKPARVPLPPAIDNPNHPVLLLAESELKEFFEGRRTIFTVPLDPIGTAFQTAVWRALSEIPFGETRSYLQIAKRIGNAGAVRAVGAAHGRNPISIIVPCHRVIGSSGKLTGFAGGLETKQFLLNHERGASAKTDVHLRSETAKSYKGTL